MALTRNKPRAYANVDRGNTLPLAASSTVFEGSAIGIQSSTGRARALVAGDLFAGFASAGATSVNDVAGAPTGLVRLHAEGEVQLAVSGVTATSIGASVFASDDDTFALTGTSLIGEVLRVPAAGQAVVGFLGGRNRLSSAQTAGGQALVSEAGIGRDKRGASRLLAGRPWLRAPNTTTGLTGIGSVTLAATTRRGRACIEITSPGNASVQGFYFALPSSTTVNANQHVVFEVEDASEWVGGNWRLGFFDGAAGVLSNGVQHVQTVDRHSGWTGVHCLAPLNVATTTSGGSTSEWANVGAGSFATTMTQCAFRCVRKSGASATTRIWVYEIAEAEKNSLPQIVIGADDGAKTWYTDGLPLCEKYGFSSYMAFIADERGTATRMSQAEWADAVARGHHAVVHGCRQINGTTVNNLTEYFADFANYGYASAEAAILADITYHRDIMVSEGLDPDGLGRTVYVLPQGYYQLLSTAGDMRIENAMRAAGMVGARRALVQNAVIANGGWSGSSLYLPIIGHTWANANEATNITNVVSQMQTEIAAGRSVVFMFHEVRASPSAGEHITAANLETILAAAATLVRAGSARAGRLPDLVYELRSYNSPVHIGV